MLLLSSSILKDLNAALNNYNKYNKLSTMEQDNLVSNLNILNNKYKIVIQPQQIIYMRDTYVYLLSKTKGTQAHRVGDNIIVQYNKGIFIMDIAEQYNLPPMTVVRQILIEKKYESHKIDAMIKRYALPNPMLPQLSNILRNDPSFWFQYKHPNIYNKLHKLQCNIKIKYDIKKEKNIIKSPDILIDEQGKPCVFKKQLFHWIVFKPYILFDNYLHQHDIQKTINNFGHYGSGLILYNDIICSRSFLKKVDVSVNTYDFLD